MCKQDDDYQDFEVKYWAEYAKKEERMKKKAKANYVEAPGRKLLSGESSEIPEENRKMGCNHPGPICEA